MYKNIIDELKKIYPQYDFKVVIYNNDIGIYHTNKHQKDDKFIDNIISICEKYLSEDELFRLSVVYDYLHYI